MFVHFNVHYAERASTSDLFFSSNQPVDSTRLAHNIQLTDRAALFVFQALDADWFCSLPPTANGCASCASRFFCRSRRFSALAARV